MADRPLAEQILHDVHGEDLQFKFPRRYGPYQRCLTLEQYRQEAAERAAWNEKLPKPLDLLQRVFVPRETNGKFQTSDGTKYERDSNGSIRRRKM
jgi:hypothetical protein